jgi:hypothetical protein
MKFNYIKIISSVGGKVKKNGDLGPIFKLDKIIKVRTR